MNIAENFALKSLLLGVFLLLPPAPGAANEGTTAAAQPAGVSLVSIQAHGAFSGGGLGALGTDAHMRGGSSIINPGVEFGVSIRTTDWLLAGVSIENLAFSGGDKWDSFSYLIQRWLLTATAVVGDNKGLDFHTRLEAGFDTVWGNSCAYVGDGYSAGLHAGTVYHLPSGRLLATVGAAFGISADNGQTNQTWYGEGGATMYLIGLLRIGYSVNFL